MTLKEWSKFYSVSIQHVRGSIVVMCNNNDNTTSGISDARWDLYNLSDYAVNMVSGDTCYLVERITNDLEEN